MFGIALDNATHSLTHAGFVVGTDKRAQLLPQDDVCLSDVLLSLPFTGLHANAACATTTTLG